jgi:hypothetical protein
LDLFYVMNVRFCADWETAIEASLQHKAQSIHTTHLFHLQKFSEVR